MEQIYLIFVFGHLDFMNVYSMHIWDEFGGYSANIRYILEYEAQNIQYWNMNIHFIGTNIFGMRICQILYYEYIRIRIRTRI